MMRDSSVCPRPRLCSRDSKNKTYALEPSRGGSRSARDPVAQPCDVARLLPLALWYSKCKARRQGGTQRD